MIRTYWYRRVPNLGDALGPMVLRHYGIAVEWARPADAELVTIGSVLSMLPARWSGTVIGSGLIGAGRRADLAAARVLAVRGSLTRDACRLRGDTPIGDPGILAPDLLGGATVEQHGDVLVIPHYVDTVLARRHPEARPVDVQGHPLGVIAQIAGARLVITSSLHAAIVADAAGVEHVVEPHPAVIGGLFKFHDYVSALGETIEPGIPRLTARPAMLAAQERLRTLFRQVA